MLRSFRFANHRSFRDEQELCLLPVYDRAGRSVVQVAAIYGANASGKSNVLDAFRFMAEAVQHSYAQWDPAGAIPRLPFRLSPEGAAEPSWFAVDVVAEGVRYEYGFSLDDGRVVEEWLHSYPQRKKRMLFSRKRDEITFGASVGGPKASLSGMTRPSALLLTVAAHAGVEPLLAVYHWFRNAVRVVDLSAGPPSPPSTDAYRSLSEAAPRRAERLIELLKAADLGISGVRLPELSPIRIPIRFREWAEGSSPELTEQLGEYLRQLRSQQDAAKHSAMSTGPTVEGSPIVEWIQYEHPDRKDPAPITVWLAKKALEENEYGGARWLATAADEPELQLVHGDVVLPMADESAGTRGWFALLWLALPVLDDGGLLVVDELDSHLHPLLTARLLQLFHSAETNPRGAQLIFAAHDTSLLGTSLSRETLRRDEVWFVEKDVDGSSKLFPLTRFRPRNGENPERRYLGGSYGAVPFLDDEAFGDPSGSVPA